MRGDDPRTDLLAGTSLRFTWPWDWLLGYVSLSIPSLSDVAASQVPSVAAAALIFTVLGGHGWLQMVIIDIVVPKIDIFAFSTGRFNIVALDGHLFEAMMATCHHLDFGVAGKSCYTQRAFRRLQEKYGVELHQGDLGIVFMTIRSSDRLWHPQFSGASIFVSQRLTVVFWFVEARNTSSWTLSGCR